MMLSEEVPLHSAWDDGCNRIDGVVASGALGPTLVISLCQQL